MFVDCDPSTGVHTCYDDLNILTNCPEGLWSCGDEKMDNHYSSQSTPLIMIILPVIFIFILACICCVTVGCSKTNGTGSFTSKTGVVVGNGTTGGGVIWSNSRQKSFGGAFGDSCAVAIGGAIDDCCGAGGNSGGDGDRGAGGDSSAGGYSSAGGNSGGDGGGDGGGCGDGGGGCGDGGCGG